MTNHTDRPKRPSGGQRTAAVRQARYRATGRVVQVRLTDPAALEALDAAVAAGLTITQAIERALCGWRVEALWI